MTRGEGKDKAATAAAALWIRWQNELHLVKHTDLTEAELAVLEKHHIRGPLAFCDFKGFVGFVARRWGSFGKVISASHETIKRAAGIGGWTVRRRLNAAVDMGYLRKVRRHTTTDPAVYEITTFWTEKAAPGSSVDNAVPEAVLRPPMGVSTSEWTTDERGNLIPRGSEVPAA